MLTRLAHHWWMFVLRGVAAILFGILAIVMPHITLAVLIILFGAYAFVDGIFLTISAISGWRHLEDPWIILLEGLIGIGIGAVTFHDPTLTAQGLLLFIAAWSLATGVLEIVSAMRLRKELTGEIWLLLSGVVSILFAVVLMWYPEAGLLGLVWVIGFYAIFFGMTLIALGLKLNRFRAHLAAAA
jgi:uncharacterized membrane protein HdeD (DUF308 family)